MSGVCINDAIHVWLVDQQNLSIICTQVSLFETTVQDQQSRGLNF